VNSAKIHLAVCWSGAYPHYAICSTRAKFQWEISTLASNITCQRCKRIAAGDELSVWAKKKLKRAALSGEAKSITHG
jgi:hypothetical protein